MIKKTISSCGRYAGKTPPDCLTCELPQCKVTLAAAISYPDKEIIKSPIPHNMPKNPVKHYYLDHPEWEELFVIKHNTR